MSKNKDCCVKKTSIGGQALMEGIMMRGPETTAMAVRNTQGEIVIEKFPTETKKRAKFFKLPLVRGLFNYIDSMMIGTKCLMRSAEISGLEEAEEELRREKEAKKAEKAAKKAKKSAEKQNSSVSEETAPTPKEKTAQTTVGEVAQAPAEGTNTADGSKKKEESPFWINLFMIFSVVLGLVLGVGLFMILPTFIYGGAAKIFPFLNHENPAVHSLIKSVFEGVLKLILIIGYMSLMILMKDIRRTFQFHGAEHKTIFCYEAGLELTVENIREQKRFHPRCGTSFLILMILVSIFISFFIDPLFLLIFGFVPRMLFRALIKLMFLPLIVGIGYELIKLAGKYDNWFTKVISAPGVWLQHITVLEPDDSMIECAIAAMKEVIPENGTDKW